MNAPYFTTEFDWGQSAIFWFGQNEQGLPGRNYADVRVAYTADALHILVTVADYYLWFDEPAQATDFTRYDAVALYLDTAHDRAAAPQRDDYWMLLGARDWPNGNSPEYHRQARGTGSGWDTSWPGEWSDYTWMDRDCNPGPNSNACGIDFGWSGRFMIPFSAIGMAGPPPEGTVIGLGVVLYDRDDQPPAGAVQPEAWPETFQSDNPSTWGEIHFGDATYRRPAVAPKGMTVIRAASSTDNTVEDAWMGGGGGCSGGQFGGSAVNHGNDPDPWLFVGTETRPVHLPCFSKSFLRFSLSAIPPGKSIISASLTLHVWGGAGTDPGTDPSPQPSWVHLFTISDAWDEMGIHWNNAPLAQENVSAQWLFVRYEYAAPGDAYEWDASQAVAEAYANGEPLSVAVYGSDTAQHSSKYMTASEEGDWNAEGRPKLVVVWGDAARYPTQPRLTRASRLAPAVGGYTATYSLVVLGRAQPLTLTDEVPTQVSAPLFIQATSGTAGYDAGSRRVQWSRRAGDRAIRHGHVCRVGSGRSRSIVGGVVDGGPARPNRCDSDGVGQLHDQPQGGPPATADPPISGDQCGASSLLQPRDADTGTSMPAARAARLCPSMRR